MASSVKYRWYQTDVEVIVEVPIKNLAEENVLASFTSHGLALTVKLPNDEEYSLKLNLRNAIVPNKCSYTVRSMKIEMHLAKEMHSQWTGLEKEEAVEPKPKVQPKNWDKVVKDNWSEKDENESVDQLFAKIYADGSDDQKKAMLKSFTESGGTVLSTNWDEVKKQKVEMKPPDGVEFKSWN